VNMLRSLDAVAGAGYALATHRAERQHECGLTVRAGLAVIRAYLGAALEADAWSDALFTQDLS
jgi:uncharacterized protein YfiM (DUF2279 family)